MKATGASSSSRGSYLVLIVQFIYVFQFILFYMCVLEQSIIVVFMVLHVIKQCTFMCMNSMITLILCNSEIHLYLIWIYSIC